MRKILFISFVSLALSGCELPNNGPCMATKSIPTTPPSAVFTEVEETGKLVNLDNQVHVNGTNEYKVGKFLMTDGTTRTCFILVQTLSVNKVGDTFHNKGFRI